GHRLAIGDEPRVARAVAPLPAGLRRRSCGCRRAGGSCAAPPSAQDGVMDPRQIDAYQMAGQDIPWLLSHWAERKPDHPFLIWEPKSGTGRQWTYREFLTDVRRLAAG